jgi:hypothetical protein
METGDRTRLTEDERFEIRMVSIARLRRNRPMWVCVLAGLVLATSLVVLLWAYMSYAGTKRALYEAKVAQAGIEVKIEELRAIDRQQQEGLGAAHDPYPSFASDMQGLAQRHGIQSPPIPEAAQNPIERNGIREQRYTMRNVQSNRAESLVGFLDAALKMVPGLGIRELQLAPRYRGEEPAGWTMTVTFSRLEKAR